MTTFQAPQVQTVSLRPSEFVAGGLIEQGAFLVKQARFVNWDYNGQANMTIAAKLTLLADDDSEYDQYYSCGDPKNFAPSADGTELIPIGQATALNENSNFAILLKQLAAAGFPEARMDSRITFIENLYGFMRRVKSPERAGLQRTGANADRPQTVLIYTEIYNLPWEQPKRGTPAMNMQAAPVANGTAVGAVGAVGAPVTASVNGAVVAAAASPAAPGVSADLENEARTWLQAQLAQPPFNVTRQGIATTAFQAFNTHPNRDALINLIYSEDWLRAEAAGGRIGFDGTNISRVG